MTGARDATRRMPDPPGLDVTQLEAYLRREHPGVVGDGALSARVIAGGRSNLTYRVDGGPRPLVVRRPPLGHVQTTAHDMAREHRVITALRGSRVPVPPTVALVDDPTAGTGGVFYVMDLVEGTVLAHKSQNTAYTADELRTVSLELATLLAELHAIEPADVGLADLGKADGYLDRQLRRWRTQLDGSRSRPVPSLDDLQERLAERVPATRRSSIVHGDYRLDNVLVGTSTGSSPRITAILDWEMATLGDSAVDLGMLGLYWHIRDITGGDSVGAQRGRHRRRATRSSTSWSTPTAPAWAAASRSSAGTGRSPPTSWRSSSRASTSGTSAGTRSVTGSTGSAPWSRRSPTKGSRSWRGAVR